MKSDIIDLTNRFKGVTSDIGVKWEVAQITPSAAAAMLDKNTLNRHLRRTTMVQKYAADMRAGNWRLTFDPIRFAVDGSLLDGQHRLAACGEAGVPFTTVVIYGLPVEIRDVIDTGTARKPADVLAMRGYVNTSSLIAMARWLILIKEGVGTPHGGVSYNRASTSVLLEVVRKHPRLVGSDQVPFRVTRRVPSPSLVATLHYLATHHLDKAERAEAFVEVLSSGVPDYENDPAHMLREFVMSTRGGRSRLTSKEYFPATAHVWNLFSERRGLKQFKWPKDATIDGLDVEKLS